MFPPPTPWKQLTAVDPDREYMAFTSRFFLKSFLRVPAFLVSSVRIMRQADAPSGVVGWSPGANLFRREFYTLSAWEDAAALRRFVRDGSHHESMEAFDQAMRRKSIFVYYKVSGRDLPLTWKDAIARQGPTD